MINVIYIKYPWYSHFTNAKQRCTNPKATSYEIYGGRGIKFLLTKEEVEELWFRDKAYLMEYPNLSRKDNDGDYCINNCEFIEKVKNTAERNTRVSSIPIIQYDLQGNFIREWPSQAKAAKGTNQYIQCINKCLKGKYFQAGGSIWRYK